ncbi:hypothetical protein HanHA300_Chr09g0328721 [Helianthus annuus]|nr:hypothetical protein HanHA300_Chr09g0328721 [Helianthus annuus]KAJ0543337.1 hypothetical protein HanHA89_Chr09g0349611 [Helianthus annuus]KAJ0708395.1 hypothetical protein HanLR1_Chr09g0328961 [Helianthus annuus]KAJ0712323.1 hypothetical protein HanOQP8_Chr09g0333591 [Helianthus annuus]
MLICCGVVWNININQKRDRSCLVESSLFCFQPKPSGFLFSYLKLVKQLSYLVQFALLFGYKLIN